MEDDTMKFIAKIDIGGFKKGEEVPEDKAKLWNGMYEVPPCEIASAEKEKELNLDLNGDGKFDEKDKSIAAKVLATRTKRKSKLRGRRR